MTNTVLNFTDARRVLAREHHRLAFLIGNGINLFDSTGGGLSWDQLMEQLVDDAANASDSPREARRRLLRLLKRGEDGQTSASQPEILDILDAIRSKQRKSKSVSEQKQDLQSRIAHLLEAMKPSSAHEAVIRWAVAAEAPILTTNYDHCLEDALADKCPQRRFGTGKPKSDYYPWDRYYSPHKISDPLDEFAIWHVHGDRELRRSIRAGLDQYMGMAQRLRTIKQSIAREILDDSQARGEELPAFHDAPWLRIFMGRKLFIQGLGLRAAEVSLRWLLIQRFRYWNRYRPSQSNESGWYVHGPTNQVNSLEPERRAFFENVGLKVVEIKSRLGCYEKLYRRP